MMLLKEITRIINWCHVRNSEGEITEVVWTHQPHESRKDVTKCNDILWKKHQKKKRTIAGEIQREDENR